MAKKKKKDEDSDSDSSSDSSSSSSSSSDSDSSSSDSEQEDKKAKKTKGKAKKKQKGKKGKESKVQEAPKVRQFKLNRKPGRKRRNIRKRATELDSSDDETGAQLANTVLLQKIRKRGGGMIFNGEEEEKSDGEEESHDLQSVTDGKQEGGLVENDMNSGFKNEISEHVVVNEQMEKYIQQKIDEQRAREEGYDPAQQQAPEKKKTAEEELYEIPDFLRHDAEEVEESGDRWLTGIAEVELPVSVKLANIERTELAKADLAKKRAQSGKTRGSQIPKNFNSNYKKHNADWIRARQDESDKYRAARAVKEGRPIPEPKRQKKGMYAGYENKGGSGSVPYATDDRTMDRFVKRYKWRG